MEFESDGEIPTATLPANEPSPIRPGLISQGKTPEERVAILDRLFQQLDQIGTPEEQAETHEVLMKALAETRREEGRLF